MSYDNNAAMKMMTDILNQRESLILEQLNELISRGLLVVEVSQPVLYQNYEYPNKIHLAQTVNLKLKDQEYIEKLEAENNMLRKRLNEIEKAFKIGFMDKL